MLIDRRLNDSEALRQRGEMAGRSGDTAAALELISRAVELSPDNAHAQYDLAELLRHLGRYDAALASYDRVIALAPQSPEAHCGRGNVLRKLGQLPAAVASYERAIALRPDFARAHSFRGNVLSDLGEFATALVSYDVAISLEPRYAEAYANRAFVLRSLGNMELALDSYDRALGINPRFALAHNNRGNLLREMGRLEEALASYDRAVAVKPDYAEAYVNRALAQQALSRLDDALASYDRAIAVKPDYAEAYVNRAFVQQLLLRLDESLESSNKALGLRPDYPAAHFSRAVTSLLTGRLREGWVEYEWRWKTSTFSDQLRSWTQPWWRGDFPLAGKRILLHSEQGYGDTLQFCRYATLIASMGAAEVILEAQKSLQPLLTHVAGVSVCVARGDPLPPFDVHCPLMSLPLVLGTDLGNIPASARYLQADPARIAQWEARLGPRQVPRIGLVWSGNRAHANDRNRSIALSQLICHLPPGFQYIALLKEIEAPDVELIEGVGFILDVSNEIDDFSDTAALCECVDLVISVDTAVAHLAGALGKRVWILLPYSPDWRWLLNRDDSPWYPSATLYRQPQLGDWLPTLERVRADLLAAFGFHTPEVASSRNTSVGARSDLIGAYVNRGQALLMLGRREEALQCYLEVIRLNPRYAPAHSDCALILTELERPLEAIERCDAAIALAPDLVGAHANRGTALKWVGRSREALQSFQAAVRLAPNSAEIHWNISLCLLQLGQLEEGWQEHEWRKRMQQPLGVRQLPHRAWLGQESLRGKTLFLHAEQGLGDTMQFCRYAKLAVAQGARVVMSVPTQLRRLLGSLDPAIRVVADEELAPEADFQCAMLSMPLAMQTRLDTIPELGRYLCSDPERVHYWRARIGTHGLRVGIRWQGRTGIRADIGRSPPLASLAPLGNIPGVRLISLQKGAGSEQMGDLGRSMGVEVVLDDDEGPDSLMETAALIDCLDLVITSDTSIAHLAGALARPTWVALKYSPDWRWLLDRSYSPWYRSMRLFRQSRLGDWQGVFESMRQALVEQSLGVAELRSRA